MKIYRTGATANHGTDMLQAKRATFSAGMGAEGKGQVTMKFMGSFDGRSKHKYEVMLSDEEVRSFIAALVEKRNEKDRGAIAEMLSESVRNLTRAIALGSGVSLDH